MTCHGCKWAVPHPVYTVYSAAAAAEGPEASNLTVITQVLTTSFYNVRLFVADLW